MRFKNLIATVAVVGLGLTACAPVNDPVSNASSTAKSQMGKVALSVRSAQANAQAKSVTLYKVVLTDANGVTATLVDSATGVQFTLGSPLQFDYTNVADGTYTSMAVTFSAGASGTQKTINFPVNITVAGGQATSVVLKVDADKATAASNGSATPSDVMSATSGASTDAAAVNDMHTEGKITAIADDKTSFTFQPEHSDTSVTVNIVSGSTDPANDTQIADKSGAKTVADLMVGMEVEVAGSVDAATKAITATMITIETEDSEHAMMSNPDAVRLMGDLTAVDTTANTVTVKLAIAKGALPNGTTDVTVNVSETTKLVKACGKATLADLAVGDKVFVRGDVVRVDNAATAAVNAKLIVVKGPMSAHKFEVHGTVSALNTTDKTFTLTRKVHDMNGNTVDGDTVSVVYTDAKLKNFDKSAKGELEDGQRVEVEGKLVDNVLNATSVEFDGVPSQDMPKVVKTERMGKVSAVDATAKTFVLTYTTMRGTVNHDLTVDFTNATLKNFNGAEIAVDQMVEVVGTLDDAGVLKADKVELIPAAAPMPAPTPGGTTGGGNSANTKTITFNGVTYKVKASHVNATSGCTGCHDPIPASLP